MKRVNVVNVKLFNYEDTSHKIELTCSEGIGECFVLDIYNELIDKFVKDAPTNTKFTNKNIIACLFLPDDQITIKFQKIRTSTHLKALDIIDIYRQMTLKTFQYLFTEVTKINGVGPKSIEKFFEEYKKEGKVSNEKLTDWISLAQLTPNLVTEPVKAKFHHFLNSNPNIKNQLTDREIDVLVEKFQSFSKGKHGRSPASIDVILSLLQSDPYKILGYSGNTKLKYFAIYDKIALRSLDISIHDSNRILYGIQCFMYEYIYKEGHTFENYDTFIKNALAGLKLTDSDDEKKLLDSYLKKYVASLGGKKILVHPKLKDAEIKIASAIQALIDLPEYKIVAEIPPSNYTEEQFNAISDILTHPISILNGPPGSGKTHVQDAVNEYLLKINETIVFSAPTGIACKNITKAIKSSHCKPHTVQKLITYDKLSESSDDYEIGTHLERLVINDESSHNDNFPITCLVIDESSMIDTIQFATLITTAAKLQLKVILVGDVDQLPSIGPGKVLKDLIGSHKLPVLKLTRIFRQKSQTIALNARKINNGETNLVVDKSFMIKHLADDETTLSQLKQLIPKIKQDPTKFGLDNFDIMKDLLIFTPYSNHSNLLSSTQLNRQLAPFFNNSHNSSDYNTPFQLGDRVIYTKNNIDLELVNGDIGFIEYTYKGDHYINFNKWTGLIVTLKKGNTVLRKGQVNLEPFKILEINGDNAYCGLISSKLYENDHNEFAIKEWLPISKLVPVGVVSVDDKYLKHAYAITVHKAQGTGIRIAVIMLPHKYNTFLVNRELMYTAVTRATDMVIVLGDNIERAIKSRSRPRNTLLKERLKPISPQVCLSCC